MYCHDLSSSSSRNIHTYIYIYMCVCIYDDGVKSDFVIFGFMHILEKRSNNQRKKKINSAHFYFSLTDYCSFSKNITKCNLNVKYVKHYFITLCILNKDGNSVHLIYFRKYYKNYDSTETCDTLANTNKYLC